MNVWELVVRALSHYGRATRQDHMIAQTLLEQAEVSSEALAA